MRWGERTSKCPFCSVSEEKRLIFNLSMPSYSSGLGAGSIGGVSGCWRQSWCAGDVHGGTHGDASVVWGSTGIQGWGLLRMHKRIVEFCSLPQSLIDLAELMRKIQENIYYKLLLNKADLK